MTKPIRFFLFFLALIILAVSLALLAWGFWPAGRETRILNIQPAELVLPTPDG